MNFQQLEYSVALERHKHFGKASESCHVTQATMSAMIKKLEEEIGYSLFDRSRHPIKTTEKGLKFIEVAKEILKKQESLFKINNSSIDALEGTLKIGVIPTIATNLLSIILPDLLSANPKLSLEINEITTEEITQQLLEDKIDLGILATPLDFEFAEESILYYEAMMVYGVKGSKKTYVSSADVKDKQIWLLEEGHCFRNQAMTICDIKEKESKISNLNFQGNSFETLLNLSDKFGGFTLIPELYFRDLPPSRQASARAFQKPIPVREVSLVTMRPLANEGAMSYLTSFIQERVKDRLSTKNYKNNELEIIGI